MKINTPRLLLAVGLLVPITIAPTFLRADDHKIVVRYHDKEHNDDHEWNSHEDQAYRAWAKEGHRKNNSFAKLKEQDQQDYWKWRHNHSDDDLRRK